MLKLIQGRPSCRSMLVAAGAVFLLASLALYSTATLANVEGELDFVLNTFSFLVWAALVMWMCAGFTMLEAGSVRTKNASVICLKNIGLYSIAALAYFVIGYDIMYSAFDSSFDFFYSTTPEELALLNGDESAIGAVVENGYAVMSDWFFQMVFVATTASIVSGTVAERVKLWPFFMFTLCLTAVIYPVVGHWTWYGDGWLAQMGFTDFAGSTIVHSTGGWAALAGALVLGARLNKFRKDGSVKTTPPSNVPAVTLGVFILWLGWFGFNGGSQLALASAADAVSMSIVLVNTNLAAAAGVMVAMAVAKPLLGRTDLLSSLNGAIAGLVAITAGPDIQNHLMAVFIGAVGGLVCVLGMKCLEKLKIDDVVGAVPAHLFAGIWGTLAVCLSGKGDFMVQLAGILSVGAFVFTVSWVVWFILAKTVGVRVSREVEQLGQDAAELKIEAYPEFVLMPDDDPDDDH